MSFDPAKVFSELKGLPTMQALDVARGLLALFLPLGVHGDIDQVCNVKLGIPKPPKLVITGSTSYVLLRWAAFANVQ